MDPAALRELLDRLTRGEANVEEVLEELKTLPFRSLGPTATLDSHRHLRQGFPEVVLGVGKTAEQIAEIMAELGQGGGNVLATRVEDAKAEEVRRRLPEVVHHQEARALVLERRPFEDRGRGVVLVVTAGTGDRPVAEEAALTACLLGNRVERVYDVGVAGIHRTLARLDALRSAEVLIVVAGMEGALPSVVAGLVERPVIAVPTSVGYGASFAGLAALLGMLSSCAAGVTAVNIDNGFGAALINRRPGA
jgi:pyridinium-3,5-biscarboxylic acid mononucleotide synthase